MTKIITTDFVLERLIELLYGMNFCKNERLASDELLSEDSTWLDSLLVVRFSLGRRGVEAEGGGRGQQAHLGFSNYVI